MLLIEQEPMMKLMQQGQFVS